MIQFCLFVRQNCIPGVFFMEEKRSSFTSSLGFVLAAAGSAVGLGNIWRFPYVTAKDGGGLFLLVYLILLMTFGFSLLVAEITIGRMTRQSPLTAYGTLNKKWGFLGLIACLVPLIITPYYSVIGGWVCQYFFQFLSGNGLLAAEDGYFTGFITGSWGPIVMFLIFLGITVTVVAAGVDDGIEKISSVLMPILFVLVIIIAVYSLTMSYTDSEGVTRTGLQGAKYYLIPDFSQITVKSLLGTVMDAMGQMFYSLSVAMGIMIAYGSYMKDETDIVKSINQIHFFDTGVAFFAGLMIVPAVFTFMGPEGMSAGPGLMFVSLPKVFSQMGLIGTFIGILFFLMVVFAALTSSISLMEAVVSSFCDKFGMNRKKSVIVSSILIFVIGIIVCLGYNVLYFDYTLPNGAVGQILDILDYITNNVMMPVLALLTCILVGWIVGVDKIEAEITKCGTKFRRKGLFTVMIKFIAPVMLFILLLQAFGIL